MSKNSIILFTVSFAMFMEALDTTIINTAIPAMAHSLNVNPVDLKIALISYLLSLAIFIPISGWVADKFGIKKVFMTAIAIFTLSSFWCGFTNNLMELVIARTIQGIGGSMMLPVGRLIIVRTFPKHELIAQMSRVVMIGAMGMMLGPMLGGVITHLFSWRWIFWVNIPVGLFTLVMVQYWFINEAPQSVPRLDKLGFILFGTGLATLTFGLSAISESNAKDYNAVSIIFVALILLFFYVFHSRKQKHPIVKTELLTTRTFRISVVGNLFSRFGFGGVPFLVPLLLQIGLGYSAQTSGFLLAPTAIGVLLVKPFSVHLLRLFGYKKLLIINTFLVGFSLWTFALITKHTPFVVVGLLTFLFGFLISQQYSSMNSLAYAAIEKKDLSAATSIMSTIQQLSQSFGVAIAAILIGFFSQKLKHHYVLTAQVFHETFFALGIITFFSVIIFIRLRAEDGHELIERAKQEMPTPP